jgi:hypothetical protein
MIKKTLTINDIPEYIEFEKEIIDFNITVKHLDSGKQFIYHSNNIDLYRINKDIQYKIINDMNLPLLNYGFIYDVSFVKLGKTEIINLDFINYDITVIAIISQKIYEYNYSGSDDDDSIGSYW